MALPIRDGCTVATSSTAGQPEPASNILLEARTVALIVHGVGDHTQMNILDELDLGLARTLPAGSFETDRLRIDGIPQPSGQLGSVNVTRILTEGCDRLIIPVIWSREHLRAEPYIKHQFFIGTNSVQRLYLFIAKAARPLLELCGNAFRCIPKGASVRWRLALTVVALLLLALVVCLTLGLGYGMTFLPYILKTHTHSFTSWPYLIAVAIIPALILFIFRMSMPVLDLIGDVAFYIGQPERRHEVERRMLKIINWVRDSAPHADIIVVGHSLGSVLVSHSLKDAPAMPAPRRLLLTTLGSPLPMMSRVFLGHVLTPNQLVEIYSRSRPVSFWMHLWRDSDWIGRSLHMESTFNFTEVSVGDGLHPNYWADSRIWAKLIALMVAQESGKVGELTREWATRELTDSEKRQALQLYQVFRVMSPITMVALAALGYVGRDVFGAGFAATSRPAMGLGGQGSLLCELPGTFPAGIH